MADKNEDNYIELTLSTTSEDTAARIQENNSEIDKRIYITPEDDYYTNSRI